jgi:hypothetical protein
LKECLKISVECIGMEGYNWKNNIQEDVWLYFEKGKGVELECLSQGSVEYN